MANEIELMETNKILRKRNSVTLGREVELIRIKMRKPVRAKVIESHKLGLNYAEEPVLQLEEDIKRVKSRCRPTFYHMGMEMEQDLNSEGE